MSHRPLVPGRVVTVILNWNGWRDTLACVRSCQRLVNVDNDLIVIDNGSTDGTAQAAASAGAQVMCEPRRGKGNVVRRMFAEVEADVYVMADGDGTYDASFAPRLVQTLLDERLDMVVGARAGKVVRGVPGGWWRVVVVVVVGAEVAAGWAVVMVVLVAWLLRLWRWRSCWRQRRWRWWWW